MRIERSKPDWCKTREIRVFLWLPMTLKTNATYQYRPETRWLEMATILQAAKPIRGKLVWKNDCFLDSNMP